MKYVLYHSSITNDKSAFEKLRAHARDGEIQGEYFDDLSSSKDQPQLEKALDACRDTGAMLLIMDLTVVNQFEETSEVQGVQVKRLM